MPFTTAPPESDPADAVPELRALAMPIVRLHPRRGEPGVRDSHLGGPLLWPADEEWPRCTDHRDVNGRPYEVWLGPVAQLHARDLPGVRFPEGTDLVQVLWCAEFHRGDDGEVCRVVWRRAADVREVLVPDREEFEGWREERSLPLPCTVSPERCSEYPPLGDLPPAVRAGVEAWQHDRDDDPYYYVSDAPGWKSGGALTYCVGEPPLLECRSCGAPLSLLLRPGSFEYTNAAPATAPDRWCPLEERGLLFGTPAHAAASEPTGMIVGRWSDGGFYVCTADPRHPASCFID